MATTETNAELIQLANERIERDKGHNGFSHKVMQKLVDRIVQQEAKLAEKDQEIEDLKHDIARYLEINVQLNKQISDLEARLIPPAAPPVSRIVMMKVFIQKHDDGTATILMNPIKSNGRVFAPDAIGPLPLIAAEQIVADWEAHHHVQRIEL